MSAFQIAIGVRDARSRMHSAITTRTWDISAITTAHSINGRFVNVLRIYNALAWGNKARGRQVENQGQLELLGKRKDDVLKAGPSA